MQWIKEMRSVQGVLQPLYVDEFGREFDGSLKQAASKFPNGSLTPYKAVDFDLSQMTEVDAQEYLSAVGLALVGDQRQSVYELSHEGMRYVVPTTVLITALVGRLSSIGDWLLRAGSLDTVALATRVDDVARIRFHPKSLIAQAREQVGTQERYLWLTAFPSARRTWSSVHAHACDGDLKLRLPLALVSATFKGVRKNATLHVTQISVTTLRPLEQPILHADLLTDRVFTFNAQHSIPNWVSNPSARVTHTGRLFKDDSLVSTDSLHARAREQKHGADFGPLPAEGAQKKR
jgi:hypothetical protein